MQEANALENICSELCTFLSENILSEDVQLDRNTELSNIGVDSFSLVEIILFIERKFGVVLPEEVLTPDNLLSVKTLATCLQTRLNGATAE